PATLRLQSGDLFAATSFGAPLSPSLPVTGEVVFTTSIVGYPESMTDPSYRGQILVFTQPLVGNYGVPPPSRDEFGLLKHFESSNIQVKGIIVNDYATHYSHWNAIESLGQWCARQGIPALSGVDTRAIVTLLRSRGSTLGEICVSGNASPPAPTSGTILPGLDDPTTQNLVAQVSCSAKTVYNQGASLKIALIDCGVKQNIIRCLAKRGAEVTVVPWDYNILADGEDAYDGVFISNGPGNPAKCQATVRNLSALMDHQRATGKIVPIFGICMGHQLLGLAAGFKSFKLPFGNRGHNQPAINLLDGSCVITSQNHGFALDDSPHAIPTGWAPYFRNANDGTNEGIRHVSLPYSSVQFHPEAMGGPWDTEFLFESFLADVRSFK
ncbi:small subunit of carbamoyl-phosphate synthase, partial [Entophlyctis helioformis]